MTDTSSDVPGAADGPADVADQLALKPAGPDSFRFPGLPRVESPDGLFGGQVLALALRAAGMTVADGRLPHSLHAYFLRRGSRFKDMVLNVQRDTDGRSFSARRVAVLQDSLPIFTMSASFHAPEEGPDVQSAVPMPAVPGPEGLPVRTGPFGPDHGLIEVRNVQNDEAGVCMAWARASGRVGDDQILHTCVLAHFSDLYSGLPPLATGHTGGPSLDHALWMHRPIRTDDWFLMRLEPVSAAYGRGVYRGAIWDRAGRLAATLGQEVLYSTSRN